MNGDPLKYLLPLMRIAAMVVIVLSLILIWAEQGMGEIVWLTILPPLGFGAAILLLAARISSRRARGTKS